MLISFWVLDMILSILYHKRPDWGRTADGSWQGSRGQNGRSAVSVSLKQPSIKTDYRMGRESLSMAVLPLQLGSTGFFRSTSFRCKVPRKPPEAQIGPVPGAQHQIMCSITQLPVGCILANAWQPSPCPSQPVCQRLPSTNLLGSIPRDNNFLCFFSPTSPYHKPSPDSCCSTD